MADSVLEVAQQVAAIVDASEFVAEVNLRPTFVQVKYLMPGKNKWVVLEFPWNSGAINALPAIVKAVDTALTQASKIYTG